MKVRTSAITHLCAIAGWADREIRLPVPEDTPGAMSVGYPYQEVLRRVREDLGSDRCCYGTLRVYATHLRNEAPGFVGFRLPTWRPKHWPPKEDM